MYKIMKAVLFLFLVLSFPVAGKEYPVCDVNVSKDIEKVSNLKKGHIKIRIFGVPCYEATITLEVFSGDKIIYSYKERFKPHVAIHWEDLNEDDVSKYLYGEIEDYMFIDCSELPEIEQSGDLPYYEKLLVSEKQYNDYKNSNCRAYVHTYKHYEGNRIVVFPSAAKLATVVR